MRHILRRGGEGLEAHWFKATWPYQHHCNPFAQSLSKGLSSLQIAKAGFDRLSPNGSSASKRGGGDQQLHGFTMAVTLEDTGPGSRVTLELRQSG
jgi:hypothetical protein